MLSGLPTSFADEREQIVYEMAICLGNSRWVSKGLYDRAVKALGRVGITDVTRQLSQTATQRQTKAVLYHTKPQPGTSEPAETPNEFRDFVRSVTARFIPAPGAG
jgi:hypothetical protein